MKQYFLHNGKEQVGVFSLDEISTQKLSSTDYVWYEGLDDWKSVTEIEELKPYIAIERKTTETNKQGGSRPQIAVNNVDKKTSTGKKGTINMVLLLIIIAGYFTYQFSPEVKYFVDHLGEKVNKLGHYSAIPEKINMGSVLTPYTLMALLHNHDTALFRKKVTKRGFSPITNNFQTQSVSYIYSDSSTILYTEMVSMSITGDSIVYHLKNQDDYNTFISLLKEKDDPPVSRKQRKTVDGKFDIYRYIDCAFIDMAYNNGEGVIVAVPLEES